ncbi:hypothetical protein AGMMS50268_33220 [Spirochaetia bacterium]|nr:hypothetical protein AGMMS50268_33220 [Spirochaetia bacterium]
MKKTSVFMAAALLGLLVMVTVSCGKGGGISSLDVVGKESVNSFDRLLKATPQLVTEDEMNGGWSIAAPDGEAWFVWSWDYSTSPLHDVMLVFDAKPFIDAGLEIEKLPEDIAYYDDMIMVGTMLGNDKFSGKDSALSSYEEIVKRYRASIGYHGALDHYGVNVGGGNLFEWAKDMSTNDKDMVFVLNPEPFIAAGVDPNAISGWAFAPVTVDDENGKPVQVDKILKPFNVL